MLLCGGPVDPLTRWAVGLLLIFAGVGCQSDPDSGGGGEDGCASPCIGPDEELYACVCDIDQDGVYCEPGNPIGTSTEELSCNAQFCAEPAVASSNCEDACEQWSSAVGGPSSVDSIVGRAPCADNANSGSCSSWSPASEITLNSVTGVHEVDETWFDDTEADPAPLWTCDDATVGTNTAGDAFEVASANSGEALYELGLRNGDEIISINGESLDSWNDVMLAWAKLRLGGETEFTLRVIRGGTRQELEYELVP